MDSFESMRPNWFLVFSLIACDGLMPDLPAENEILDGPIAGLTTDQHARFLAGDRAFNDAIFTPSSGLGPLFVATSCGSCHAGDGKGHPFTSLVRFGQPDANGNQYLQAGGPQLQHHAIPGYEPEILPAGAPATRLLPPANTGLGLLEAVSDSALLALADPGDTDGDGISGRVNWIDLPDFVEPRDGAISSNGKYIGRLGKKAAVYNLLQQTVTAYNEDIGITSTYLPRDTYSGLIQDPEVSDKTINDVVFYLQTLKAPVRRNSDRAAAIEGEGLFTQMGCAKCHRPELETGTSPVAGLANRTARAYTDLLLHDMGPGLDDGYTEGSAATSEWRTPALWGLGLSGNSQGGQYYLMHDGRARTLGEAIIMHGGEAAGSRSQFEQLEREAKEALYAFLESL